MKQRLFAIRTTGPSLLWSIAFVGLLGVVSAQGAQHDTSAKEVQRLQLEMAVRALVKVSIDELHNGEIQESSLLTEMIERPAEHISRRESYGRLKAKLTDAMKETFVNELQRIVKETPWGEVALDDQWPPRIMKEYAQEIDAAIAANLRRNYDAAFEKAREGAVQLQWGRFVKPLYPADPKTVEQMADSPAAEREWRAKMVRDTAAQGPLFEENTGRVQQSVEEVLRDAKAQLTAQRSLIQKSTADNAITTAGIVRQLRGEVQQLFEGSQPRPGQTLYGMFPSVEATIPQRAQVLMRKKFEDYLQQAVPSAIAQADIDAAVRSGAPVPREPNRHLEALVRHFTGVVQEKVVSAYAARPEAQAERDAFSKVLTGLLQDEFKVAYADLVRRRLEKPLEAIRKRLAEEQLRTVFPRVASGQWEVPESMLLEEKRASIAVKEFPHEGATTTLLQETEDELAFRGRKLLEEGRATLGDQRRMVDNRRPGLIEKMKERPGRTKEEWTKDFTTEVQTDWATDRRSQSQTKYTELFSIMTTTWIPDIITQCYDEAHKAPQTIEVAKRDAPQPPPPSDSQKAEPVSAPAGRADGTKQGLAGGGGKNPGPGEGTDDKGDRGGQGEDRGPGRGRTGGSPGGGGAGDCLPSATAGQLLKQLVTRLWPF